MKTRRLAVALLALGSACSTRLPSRQPAAADLPVLHGAAVHGPFPDEAAICQAVYEGQPGCLKRPNERVVGPTSATSREFGRVEIVEAGVYDDRCALLFQIADRLYVHDQPALCWSQGHS